MNRTISRIASLPVATGLPLTSLDKPVPEPFQPQQRQIGFEQQAILCAPLDSQHPEILRSKPWAQQVVKRFLSPHSRHEWRLREIQIIFFVALAADWVVSILYRPQALSLHFAALGLLPDHFLRGTILFSAILIDSVLIIANLVNIFSFRERVPALLSGISPIAESSVPVSVIIASRGVRGNADRLFENLKSLVGEQHYPNAEYILVTSEADDPAQAVYKRVQAAYPAVRIKTVVAGIFEYGSDKTNNLIKAVEASDPASQILVFLDNDGKGDPHLVQKLVSGLLSSSAAGASGMRWYRPQGNRLPDVIRTAWNSASYPLLTNPQTTFLWGGAMAFRRETFQKAGITDLWAKTLADDAPLRARLDKLGLKTLFLPNCIVVSSEYDTWRSLIEFITRQTMVVRVNFKPFFYILLVVYGIGNSLSLGLLVWGIAHRLSGGGFVAGLVGFLGIVQIWLYGGLITSPIEKILKMSGLDPEPLSWKSFLFAPLVVLIQTYSYIHCLFAKRVTWGGVTYEINGGVARRLGVSS